MLIEFKLLIDDINKYVEFFLFVFDLLKINKKDLVCLLILFINSLGLVDVYRIILRIFKYMNSFFEYF